MMKYKEKKHNVMNEYGFSLLGVAVTLGIVGVLSAGTMSMYSEQRTHVLWQEGAAKTLLVKTSLINFAKTNKFLPCPDTDGDGVENRSGIACTSNTGSIPFNDLALAASDVKDSWGNDFTYAVNKATTLAAEIADCPLNSACFFNRTAPPMFDLNTFPVMGATATANMNGNSTTLRNLRVCNVSDCDATTPGADIDADAAIAVIIAHNENGNITTGLSDAEALNASSTSNYFVQSRYSEAPDYYDDQLQAISANELKNRFETDVVELTEGGGGGGAPVNPFEGETVDVAGGNGDDNRFASVIGLNIETGILEFGSENAGQMVTLTFDATITGGWEDADALNEGVAAQTNSDGDLETQDQFVVGLNANVDDALYTIANADDPEDGRVDLQQGLDMMGNPGQDQIFYYDENDDDDNTWYEHASYNVELDANGNLKVDFAVFSTALNERVAIENIQAVQYNPPTSLPDFPSVSPIAGIPQTDDLYIESSSDRSSTGPSAGVD